MNTKKEEWTLEITPTPPLSINLKEIWAYKDLLKMFVWRDFVSVYKQSILGPLWFFIQPILTTIIFTIVFSNIARLSTDGAPRLLFYLSGITVWNYFSSCFVHTSSTFISNASIFGKVYFPRLIIPLSVVISNLLKFLIQFALFLVILFYYLITEDVLNPNLALIALSPVMILFLAALGLGSGVIISSLTTKYRDFQHLLTFAVQLLMYATPVAYPASALSPKLKTIIMLNPVSSIVELFRYAFIGKGLIEPAYLIYSAVMTIIILLAGIIIFHKVESDFIDTV
jgi:lipopolysaccharide transport system permease protein